MLYFVTTFGLAKNMYSNRVQSEVVLDELFGDDLECFCQVQIDCGFNQLEAVLAKL